ncbi:MAG: hypothetical protein A4E48_00248 [Methanosaeta sp. PtaU1.Bin060]|nr:MAG: hypothetical protein A4E48_00248 [Methanosaeta sp. PtaU1.Bin060]
MASKKMMLAFKAVLSPEPQTVRLIAHKTGKDVNNARRVLKDMQELGICKQVSLPPRRGARQAKKGWVLCDRPLNY